jgi:tetratricopeptide (TPR) repeat protein
MSRTTQTLAAAVLAAALLLLGAVGIFRHPSSSPSTTTAVGATSDTGSTNDGTGTLLTAEPGGSLGATIATLQARLQQVPGDWQASASLGLAYVQEARVTADPSYYPKAQQILHTSLRTHAHDNVDAWVGLASLSAARHHFVEAAAQGERALKIDPYLAAIYGVIGDAQLELGHYDDAFATFQKMVDTQPGLASYARVSYARELTGDVEGAVQAMRAARSVAGSPDDAAWVAYQLGELAWNAGDVNEAADRYREAQELDPTWVPPLAGMARVAWARGDTAAAIASYREVVTRYPAPENVIALGDLLTLSGDRTGADQQYALARAEAKLFAANGVNVDLELALFDADHGDPSAAVKAAKTEWRRRHSIHVADAYAWALHAAGRDEEAVAYARRALALGTRSALFRYHAGMIQLALGHDGAARTDLRLALSINPNFSILGAPTARRSLASIRGGA